MDEKNLVEKANVSCAGDVAGAVKPDTASPAASASKPKPASPFVRAENEDDDGYDPYSDFHDKRVEEPFFQKDPWM